MSDRPGWTVEEAAAFVHDELRAVAHQWWTPPEGIVGKLPRGGNGQPTTCRICKGYHKPGAVHLDFVGHADLTRTLIEIDPLWDWEPLAFDEQGLPRIAHRGSQLVLWGRLTLLGKPMLCVGTCDDKNDADKELVGDMLRNGAMRFGIFGALWSKTDGWHDDAEPEKVGAATAVDQALSTAPHPDASADNPLPPVAISQPDKPLAAMTMRELLDFARTIGVTVSGTKSDIVRTLEPLVRAASGEEPFGLDGERPAQRDDPHEQPFSPVVAGSATVRTGVNSSLKADT